MLNIKILIYLKQAWSKSFSCILSTDLKPSYLGCIIFINIFNLVT